MLKKGGEEVKGQDACLRSSRRGAKVQTEFTGPAKDTGGGGGGGGGGGTHTMEEQQRMQKPT